MTDEQIDAYLEETKNLTDEQKWNDPTTFKIFMSIVESERGPGGELLDADEFFGYKPSQAAG